MLTTRSSFFAPHPATMNIDFPYHFDSRGRTADTTDDDHIRDMIEEVLFTSPGERVNRPTFGSGLLQLVFAGNSDALAAATQLTVQASLQQWLGDLVEVETVRVERDDATLQVTLQYLIRRNQQRQIAQFTHGLA
jgi:phage baseplate assembly protein W